MTLELSLGEFTSLTAKAFRGAGYHWGLASDGAHAARVLAQHGLPAAEIVVRLLRSVERSGLAALTIDEADSGTAICPVTLGAALSDLGDLALDQAPSMIASRRVMEPVLLAPWLTSCAIEWDCGQATVDHDGIHVEGTLSLDETLVRVTPLDDQVAAASAGLPHPLSTRTTVGTATYAALIDLAARTYAPATDESRNAGAGDGAS